MTLREKWQLFFSWFFLIFVPIMFRPIWEPDEARYAEIAREMFVMHDWLTPHLNFVLYFEKPPLQYWLSALCMYLFGIQPYIAKIPLLLAGLLNLFCAWRLAKILKSDKPIVAVFMTATALLSYTCNQIFTLDALFSSLQVFALITFLEAIIKRVRYENSNGWIFVAYTSLSLAILTKGLAAPLLIYLIILSSIVFTMSYSRLSQSILKVMFNPFGWLLLFVIVLPWFILVNKANPGHAKYFFIYEHFIRFTTNAHLRQGANNWILDKFYFFGILLFGLLPWVTRVFYGYKSSIKLISNSIKYLSCASMLYRWLIATVVLSTLWPLFFYSLSHSKLPTYILPIIIPVLTLACALDNKRDNVSIMVSIGRELLILSLLCCLLYIILELNNNINARWVIVNILIFALFGSFVIYFFKNIDNYFAIIMTCSLLLLTLSVIKINSDRKDIYSQIKKVPSNVQWINAGNYFQATPFVSGRRVVVLGNAGELKYGRDKLTIGDRANWFQTDERKINHVAHSMCIRDPSRPVWALIAPKSWNKLTNLQKKAWKVRMHTPSYVLIAFR